MSVVVQSGSKQYIVEYNQKFIVDRLEQPEGDVFELDVLFGYGDQKGLKKIQVKVLKHQKGEKIRVVKYKSKSNYHRQYGFRPYQTILQVLGADGKIAENIQKADVEIPETEIVEAKPKKTVTKKTTTKSEVETPKTVKKPKSVKSES